MGGLEDTCLWLCVVSLYRLRIVCALPPTYSPLLERRVYYRNVFHQERERERERAGLSRVYPRHRAREAMHMDMPATVSGQRQGAAWRAIGESEPMRTLAATPRPPRVGDHTRVSDPSSSSSCSTEPQQQSPPERHERARQLLRGFFASVIRYIERWHLNLATYPKVYVTVGLNQRRTRTSRPPARRRRTTIAPLPLGHPRRPSECSQGRRRRPQNNQLSPRPPRTAKAACPARWTYWSRVTGPMKLRWVVL